MSIAGGDPGLPPRARPAPDPRPSGPPFVTAVSGDGRYLVDQYGKPFLVRGDSPWALMTKVPPAQAERWFANRQRNGYNAAIVSLVGATGNGGPSDDGATFDGLTPFVDGDVLAWNEPYWARAESYLRLAERHGITVMLYPIDGWTIGTTFRPASTGQCREFGARLAARFRDLPNIVWLSGGDYFPATDNPARGSDVDHCIDAMLVGLREAGDQHLFSIQLGYDKSISDDNPYWASRADWNFVYTYWPTYAAVLEAYGRRPVRPALLGEANYERENNQEDTPATTDETLRRQMLWSLTSGAAGAFSGSSDWLFAEGWEGRLDTRSVAQITRLHQLFAGLPWWQLVPDTDGQLVTAGRGTPVAADRPMDVLESAHVTAARTPDGRYAVVYLPAGQAVDLDRSALAPGVRTDWVDPASGAVVAAGDGGRLTPPGVNSQGDRDWLLLVRPARP